AVKDESIKIYAVGIGAEKGGLVPVYNNAGDTITDYLKDANGNPITSRLMPATLKQLSRYGNGTYYQISQQGKEIYDLIDELSALKKDTYAAEQIKRYKPLYQYFLGPGLLFFLLAWFWPVRRVS
ncbi:MAG: magnesium chelatase, partial [Firmicutes bacterium]|nr:magnesium chelatase [Bacillota bacterium]